jgi:hypothetical protein
VSRRKTAVFVLLACSLAVVVSAVARFWETEPRYNGKKLSEWIKIYSNPIDPTAYDMFPKNHAASSYDAYVYDSDRGRKEAVESNNRQSEAAAAVRRIGTNAIPTLLNWMDSNVPAWKWKLAAVRDKLPPVFQGGHIVSWWLVARDNYRVQHALTGFGILGPEASPAVPELTRRMNTRASQPGGWAVFALVHIGSDGLPPLLAALANTNALNRVLAARAIEGIASSQATNGTTVVRALASCLGDADQAVASWSAIGLGSLALEPEIAIPALTDRLRDSRPQIRARSADALGHFGHAALSAVPLLLANLNDSDLYVRTAVTNALQSIAPEILAKQGVQ